MHVGLLAVFLFLTFAGAFLLFHWQLLMSGIVWNCIVNVYHIRGDSLVNIFIYWGFFFVEILHNGSKNGTNGKKQTNSLLLNNIGCQDLIEATSLIIQVMINSEFRQRHKRLKYTSVFSGGPIHLCQFTTCMVVHFWQTGRDQGVGSR